METKDQLSINGKLGCYTFNIYPIGTSFDVVGGVYVFLFFEGMDKNKLIYCDITDNLSNRLINPHNWDCIKRNNANYICVLIDTEQFKREEIKKDILANNIFLCNDISI